MLSLFNSLCIKQNNIKTKTIISLKRNYGYTIPFINKVQIKIPYKNKNIIPAYQVLNVKGSLCKKFQSTESYKEIDGSYILKMYKKMVRLELMDNVLNMAQRQGRISFYMTTSGEEAINIGSASALKDKDIVFGQYREAGVLMWRGFTVQNFVDQCFSNIGDSGKGRQMPVHYGSKELNFHTISSPLATQLPQAAGAAYACKQMNNDTVVIAYFGEGAASEGDFHPALNFAATLECPCIFFCRNNGYAISTPSKEQYRGDGIVSRADGYGISSMRVDGNDIFAVREAVKIARKYTLDNNKPFLIEAMTYRQGHHSTSDDSTAYRDSSEISFWEQELNPILRLKKYLETKNDWNDELDEKLRKSELNHILKAVSEGEKKDKYEPFDGLFQDVYSEKTPELIEQMESLKEHVNMYPEYYKLN